MGMLFNIATCIAIFLIVFGISNFVLIKRKIDYLRRYPILLLFYLFSLIFVTIFYSNAIFNYFRGVNLIVVLIPLIALLASIMVYPIFNKHLKIPSNFLKKYDKAFFLRMDYRMITTKFVDVVFQDLIIFIWTMSFLEIGLHIISISIIFLIAFPILHIPLIFVHKGLMSLYYICLSVFGAVIPFLVLNIEYGLIYVVTFHWLTYLAGRLCFGLYFRMRRPAS